MRIVSQAGRAIVAAGSILGWVAAAPAGSMYDVTCTNTACRFKTEAGIGGGRAFEEASGYCAKCAKWVSVSWKRGEKAPAPVAEFWDPRTGDQRQVRKCPEGDHAFVVLRAIEEMTSCPKCRKPTLTHQRTIMYD